jgi:hypothetical protein
VEPLLSSACRLPRRLRLPDVVADVSVPIAGGYRRILRERLEVEAA